MIYWRESASHRTLQGAFGTNERSRMVTTTTRGAVLLAGYLALANCDRAKRINEHAADGPASAVVDRGSPESSDCAGLLRPPRTIPQELPSDGRYRVRASVLLSSSSDSVVDGEINGIILADQAARQRAFVSNADEAIVQAKGDPQPLQPESLGLDIECKEAWTTTRVLSIECRSSTYLGGAHPEEQHFTYNFGFCSGTRATSLDLVTLCKPDRRCKEALLDLIRRSLRAGLAKDVDVEFDNDAEVLKRFAITPTGLRFFANDDLPYAIQSAGTIDLGFERLGEILRNDGLLAGALPR